MKVIQVSYDCCQITMIVENESEIFGYLPKNIGFTQRDGGIFIRWTPNYEEECRVNDVTNDRGIIQHEEH